MSNESLEKLKSDESIKDFDRIVAVLHSEWVTLRTLAYPDREKGGKVMGGARAKESPTGLHEPGLDCLLRLESHGLTPEDDNVVRAFFLLVAAHFKYNDELNGNNTDPRREALERAWREYISRSPRRALEATDKSPDTLMDEAEDNLQRVIEKYEPIVTGAY